MSKVRVIYKSNGGVSVIHPAPKSRRKDESEEQWLERVFAKATPVGAEYDDIDSSELPQNREDRGAWEGAKGQGVIINQVKAAKIKSEKERRKKIEKEKDRILEEQAITNLEALGKI